MRPPKKHQDGYHWIPPDCEWLHNEYVTLRKSIKQIASESRAPNRTVRKWLRAHNIRVRSPGLPKGLFLGEKSPHWKGGSWPYLHREAHKAAEEQGIPEMCDRCGTTRELCVHHKDRDQRNNQLGNLRRLCKSCHKTLHWEENKYIMELLKKSNEFRGIVESLGINPDCFKI